MNIARRLREQGIDDLVILFEAGQIEFPGPKLYTPANCFNSAVAKIPGNVYYHGYWINPRWFNTYRDVLMKDLTFRPIEDSRNNEYAREIRESFSIGAHIRRGDFIARKWALPESYYHGVTTQLSDRYPNATYFIFSDEIEWCKQNAEQLGLPRERTVFVEGNFDHKNNHIDLQLMTMCNILVVGSSSFSYLASVLNQTPGFQAIQVRNVSLDDVAEL